MISAIVVTFNPDLSVLNKLIDGLIDQVDWIIIVDNGSKSTINTIVESDKLVICAIGENLGIASAQNIGLERARALSSRKFVFFDQDSNVPHGMIESLANKFAALRGSGVKIGAVVPVFKDIRYNFYYPLIVLDSVGGRKRIIPNESSGDLEISLAISSGTYTEDDVISDVGGMREDLFIDYVDTEWCLRLRSSGYKIVAISDVCMLHAIGDRFVRFLSLNLPVHSPFRRYYRVRNSFYLLKYKWVPKKLAMREVFISLAHQFILIVKCRDKLQYLTSGMRAVKDGVKYLTVR